MRCKKSNGLYVLEDYYRSCIDLDTSLDARHLVSVLVAFCPDLDCDYVENKVICKNLRNSMWQKIEISWRYTI